MRLYKQTVQDFGLYPGMDMPEEVLEKLIDAAGAMSAKMRAVGMVAASNVSAIPEVREFLLEMQKKFA